MWEFSKKFSWFYSWITLRVTSSLEKKHIKNDWYSSSLHWILKSNDIHVFLYNYVVFWNIIASKKMAKIKFCKMGEDTEKNSTIYDKNLTKNIFIPWCPSPLCKRRRRRRRKLTNYDSVEKWHTHNKKQEQGWRK